MALLWLSGFELNSTTDGVEWSLHSGTPTIQSTIVRSGTYALRINSLVSATVKGALYQFASANSNGPYYFRFYVYFSTFPSAENCIAGFRNASTIGTPLIRILVNSSGQLILRYATQTIGSPSSALSTGQWYMVEVKVDLTGGSGAHIAEARLNGQVFATASNLTIATGVMSIIVGGNLLDESQTQGDWYFDDVAINDGTGTSQNSYPNSGKLVLLLPNGAGDSNQWNKQNGAAGDANNYQNVDEIPPDNLTTYVRRDSGQPIDDYNVEDASSKGISSGDTIQYVAVGARVGATNNTAASGRNGILRIKAQSGGTVLESSSIDWSTNNWVTNSDTVPRNYTLIAYTSPQTNAAWTLSELNSMQIGAKPTASATVEIRVTTIWAYVSFQPSTGTSVNDTRGAKIKGQQTGSESRAAKIRGKQDGSDTRQAKLKGFASATSERGGKLKGFATTSAERGAKVKGTLNSFDTRSATIKGYAIATTERSGTIRGYSTASTERWGKIKGQGTAVATRAAKIKGYVQATSERFGKITGQQAAFAQRSAKITGQGAPSTTSERGAKIKGGQLITYNPKIIFVDGRPALQISDNYYIFI